MSKKPVKLDEKKNITPSKNLPSLSRNDSLSIDDLMPMTATTKGLSRHDKANIDDLKQMIAMTKPEDLARAAATNKFFNRIASSSLPAYWKTQVKLYISDNPKPLRIRDGKTKNVRNETHKEMYKRIYTLAGQISQFERKFELKNQSQLPNLNGQNQIMLLFKDAVCYGFDKIDHQFSWLWPMIKRIGINRTFENKKYTLLHFAAEYSRPFFIKKIVEEGGNVNALAAVESMASGGMVGMTYWNPNAGDSPIIIAARHGYWDCVEILIEKKANIDLVNQESRKTALIAAAENGHSRSVKALLDAGASTQWATRFSSLDAVKEDSCRELILDKMSQRGEPIPTSLHSCLVM